MNEAKRAGATGKGRRLLKFLFLAGLLVLLFGGAARLVIAGGVANLNRGDRLLGRSDAAQTGTAIRYGNGARQSLDIWAPPGTDAVSRLPVVIFFYGGGWHSGARGDYGFAARAFAEQGFIAVLPDYRLTPQSRWPDFLEDSAAAVAWTHANIARYGGDPDRIALAGHSAGGYNAAMLALDPKWLRAAGSDPSVIRGVAALAAPLDFLPLERGGSADKAMGHVRPLTATQPIAFARGDAPPLWLATGDEDTTVRPKNSRNLAAAIQAAGGAAMVKIYPGMGHEGIIMALAHPFRGRAPVLSDASDFLRGVTARRLTAQPAQAAE
jgi:acetyl esterase/lipase